MNAQVLCIILSAGISLAANDPGVSSPGLQSNAGLSVSQSTNVAGCDSLPPSTAATGVSSGSVATKQDAPTLSEVMAELKRIQDENKVLGKQLSALSVPGSSSLKVGVLAQMQGQVLQEQTSAVQDTTRAYTQHWQRQLFVRRLRALFGGELSKSTSFFVESDATNIGKVDAAGSKPTKVSMYIQDAYIQHTFMPELSMIAGLQLVGISRNSLQSAASLMALDYGAYQFLTSTPLDNTAGRDLGLNLRGFLFDERLEYRAGVFSGKNVNLYTPMRTVVRLNYMLEDREKGFFYSGTTLGKGKVLSFGGGVDLQSSFRSYSFDAFADLPVVKSGSLTASASWTYLDGGGSEQDSTFFTGAIPRQSILFFEAGYFLRDLGIQPYLKFETDMVNADVLRQVNATPATLDFQNKVRSKERFGLGLNYFLNGHGASVKVLYEFATRWRSSLTPGLAESVTTGEATIQFQYFVF
ncbi:MAG TPA: hypothetical protein VMH23_00325 [Bacteroidota bacterium]|nr:hypothetical protein [Bacteroidota bacterium]